MALEIARALAALNLVALVALGGCVSFTDPMGRKHALEESQRRYTNLVRWGEIEKAADLVDPALRQDFLGQAAALEGFRITDFEIGSLRHDADGSARVTVTYRGYSVGTYLERSMREHQRWFCEGGGNAWWVQPEIEGLVSTLGAATR